MTRTPLQSAGLLLFRRSPDLEVFLAHPGGPFWANRDRGAWTIPKGTIEDGEEALPAAIREFTEETGIAPNGPYLELGAVLQKSGKRVHAWAWEGDADPSSIKSNFVKTEWPRRSGRWIAIPEIDRCDWFAPSEAMWRINPAQATFVTKLIDLLSTD